MNEATPTGPGAEAEWQTSDWQVRPATHEDVETLVLGVSELLVELGGSAPERAALEQTAHALIDDRDAGALLVAVQEGELVGLLGVSWQHALRVAGRYGLIQELWVHPAWRGQTIGGDLLVALFELARGLDIARLEVGLPGERFAHLGATEAFYVNNGFQTVGTRMRRLL